MKYRLWLSRIFIYFIITSGLVFYFAQNFRLAPNTVDGALILGYLDEISRGGLPYWSFIDVYGPLNWVFPYLFYYIADYQVWGVRVWMIILKLLSVFATYRLIRRGSDKYYAFLGTLVTTVLLGQSWQLMQTPYASHTSFPLILTTWYCLLYPPFKHSWTNNLAAGVLTAMVLWIKLNTGMFLFAGALFYYFYWYRKPLNRPDRDDPVVSNTQGLRTIFLFSQIIGLLGYGAIFHAYIYRHFGFMYFLYLTLPLLIVVLWTAYEVQLRQKSGLEYRDQIKSWAIYLLSTGLGWSCFFLVYYGWEGGIGYLSELIRIIQNLSYEHPFLPPGAQSYYKEFSQYYWLQLPWLLTFLFILWIVAQRYGKKREIHNNWRDQAHIQASGLFILFTMHAFVLYPRSDEAHMYQALLPSVLIIFILLFQIERNLVSRKKTVIRVVLAVAVGLACSTIFTIPTYKVFVYDEGDFHGIRMRYLKFRPKDLKGVNNTSELITDHDWDIATNRAAICIDKLTEDGSEVLILTTNQLINYISKTHPFGAGYRYLFYLLKNDLIDRESFTKLLPTAILYRLLVKPPRVIVGAIGNPPLFRHFPELRFLVEHKYEVVQNYAHIFIMLRKSERVPKGICGNFPELIFSGKNQSRYSKMLGKSWFRD